MLAATEVVIEAKGMLLSSAEALVPELFATRLKIVVGAGVGVDGIVGGTSVDGVGVGVGKADDMGVGGGKVDGIGVGVGKVNGMGVGVGAVDGIVCDAHDSRNVVQLAEVT